MHSKPLNKAQLTYLLNVPAVFALVSPVLFKISMAPWIEAFSGWQRIQFNTAFGLLLASLALTAAAIGFKRIAIALALFVFTLGSATNFEHLFGIDLGIDQLLAVSEHAVYPSHPGRMAFNAAFAFSMFGLSLLLHLFGKSERRDQFSVLLAATSAGLALLTLVSKLVDHDLGSLLMSADYMSPTTAMCFLFMSLLLGALPLQRINRDPNRNLIRLPVFVSVPLVISSLFFWQYALNRDSDKLHQIVKTSLDARAQSIEETLQQTSSAISRYAARIAIIGNQNEEFLEVDSQNYISQLPIIKRLGLTDDKFKVVWSYPISTRAQAKGYDQMQLPERAEAFQKALATGKPVLSRSLQLLSGDIGNIIPVAMFRKGKFKGFAYGAIQTDLLFRARLQSLDFSVEVHDNGIEIFHQRPEATLEHAFEQKQDLVFDFAQWQVTIVPTERYVRSLTSRAPHLFLAFGLFASLLFGWLIERILRAQIAKQDSVLADNLVLEKKVTDRTAALEKINNDYNDLIRRTNHIIDNMKAVVWAVDKDGRFTFHQGRSATEIGVQSNSRVGKLLREIEDMGEYREELIRHVNTALEGRSSSIEFTRGGRVFQTEINPIISPDGNGTSGAVGVSLDVTESARIKRKLFESQNRLTAILKHVPFAFWSADTNRRIVFHEGMGMKNLNLTAQEMIGKTVDEVYGQYSAVIETYNRAALGESVEVQTQIGGRWFTVGASPMQNEKGGFAGVSGLTFDITDRKHIEDERREMEVRVRSAHETSRLKSEFLANMSHEIRTPINGVIGMTGLILGTELNDEQKDFARNIRISADALLGIINDILDFSKVEAGKLDLEEIDFDLNSSLQDTISIIKFAADKKGLALTYDYSGFTGEMLSGDPGRIRQIVTNLLSNAIKFTREGQITLRARQIEARAEQVIVRVEITDSGIGLSKEGIQKLFQPFSQADSSTTRKFGGTGLGLSISKRLVELMHGTIGVTSVENEGSTFWFEIVLKRGASKTQTAKEIVPVKNFDPLSARVLVAEDNVINQLIAQRLLTKLGCTADAVANGHEVLAALKDIPYDLVLMDCQMPELDGFETARVIRGEIGAPYSEIPIIAMTANAFDQDRNACLAAGMNDFVAKPVNFDEFAEMLRKWLPKPATKSAS